VQALALFASIFGAEAGNLAIRSMAVGGIFIGGGISPKILPALRGGEFARAFIDKGRFADLLRAFRCASPSTRTPPSSARHNTRRGCRSFSAVSRQLSERVKK